MRGLCRLLWSVIVLTSVGCQSVPSGATALFGRLSDVPKPSAETSAKPAGLAALIASRRAAKVEPVSTPSTPAQAVTLPGRWGEDDVLQMVIETEFADATPEDRQKWMQRLSGVSEDDVPRLLSERRRLLNQAGTNASALTGDEMDSQPSAQQIILTEHAHSAVKPRRHDARHPLLDETSSLAAPQPGGAHRPTPPMTPVNDEESAEPQNIVTTVFDAFGVGGETRAAQEEVAGTSRIELAGHNSIDEAVSKTKAIDRDLESNKAAQSVYWQEDLDKLITLLEAQVAQQQPGESDVSREQYVRQHVALRMLYLIAGRRPEALQTIPSVSQDQQEFWTQMFWALSSTFDEEAMPNSTMRAAETVAQLRAAIRQIESRASLQLHETVFCRQINGFGDFVSFDEGPLTAGQPVLIYTQVRNFQSESTPQGDFKTVLRSSITIHQQSLGGPVVFKYELPQTEDRCQSRRQDYFHSYRIQLPDTLKPGPHVLTLDVTDALTGKSGSTTLNFVVQ